MVKEEANKKTQLTQILKGVKPRNSTLDNSINQIQSDKNQIPSSFKLSNKLPQNGIKISKKPREKSDKEDVEIYHDRKMKYFEQLQKSLPYKKSLLKDTTDPNEKIKIEKEIKAIENRDEETNYFLDTFDIVKEYMDVSTDNVVEKKEKMSLSNILTKRDNSVKLHLSNEYYRLVDPSRVNTNALYQTTFYCEECNGTLLMNNGAYSCNDCGLVCDNAVGDYQWSYKDIHDVAYKSSFSF